VGGLGKCVTRHISEFLFFFCFLQRSPRSHFLTDRHDLYAKTHVSGQGCAFWRSRKYSTTFRGQITQKTSRKWAGIGISQRNRQSSKIAIYRSPKKIFASNITDRFSTSGTIDKVQKYKITSNGIVKGSRDLLLILWDTFNISGTVDARNFKFGMQIDHEGH